MADPEHLAKLKEGVEAWNKWRKDNPEIKPDLTEVDLAEANLRKANLRRADLGYASLTGAVLERADLTEANLFGANLRKANLFGANLRGANLRRADLAEANLEAANFMGAGNIEIEQLCEAKTLYKVQLDQEPEKQVMGKCPHLLEAPKDETGLGK
jgi:uncharacterized protein YjbI with pentapeptide repeats